MAALAAFGCGADIDKEPCKNYCSKMDGLRAYGDYTCLACVKRDINNLCAERPISEPGDFEQAPTAEDWSDPYCFRAGEIPDDFVKPASTSWYEVHNPVSLSECTGQCEANANGDAIPEELAADLDAASTLYDFLQAQLNQQCRVEAEEQ
jgi:hypothetical protein